MTFQVRFSSEFKMTFWDTIYSSLCILEMSYYIAYYIAIIAIIVVRELISKFLWN